MSYDLTSRVKLNDGHSMNRFGFGSYEAATGEETYQSVLKALRAGYRLVDTAEWYENEADCGRAVRDFMKESGTPRSEICYVTKLRDNSTERHAAEAIQQSLDYAGLDYLDLYLIHGPYPDKTARLASWDAISKAVEQGKIRSAGVSNYGIRHLKELNEHTKATGCFVKTPAVNQIDLHPFMQRREDVKYNEEQGIVLMAWGPLARGMRFDNATLKKVAEGCGKSPAQVLVRWGLQKGFVVIPKSTSEARIRQNADVFDFELKAEDVEALDGLEEYLVTDWDPLGDKNV